MPSIQWQINAVYPASKLRVIGICNTATKQWLQTYLGQTGITYPLVQDTGSPLFQMYQVGASFGNLPPTYIIIDPAGIVRFRTDDKLNITDTLVAQVARWLP